MTTLTTAEDIKQRYWQALQEAADPESYVSNHNWYCRHARLDIAMLLDMLEQQQQYLYESLQGHLNIVKDYQNALNVHGKFLTQTEQTFAEFQAKTGDLEQRVSALESLAPELEAARDVIEVLRQFLTDSHNRDEYLEHDSLIEVLAEYDKTTRTIEYANTSNDNA